MTWLNRKTFANSAPLILLSGLIITLHLARADDLTGQAQDDPKDLLPTPVAPAQPTYSDTLFAPMPGWAHGIGLGPLPDKLKPMGKGTSVAGAAQPQPLAPPKDAPAAAPAPTTTSAAAKPAPTSDPTMIAVSPFLQWIKSNPQAAAATARQQAESYQAVPPPPNNGPGANANARNNQDDSYWLPPLIDSADIGPSAVTGSAAIYSRPQR